MKQFFLEFVGLSLIGIVLSSIVNLFVPEDIVSWQTIVLPPTIMSAIYCIVKAVENGYGEDAIDD